MKNTYNILNTAKVIVLGFILAAGMQFVSAQTWTAPSNTPPGGNTYAPLNIGSSGQVKDGGLTLGHTLTNGATDCSGAPCIGLLIEHGRLKITDGTQGAGKILTSDANGIASWVAAPGGVVPSGTFGQTVRYDISNTLVSTSNLYNSGSRIGIGTTAPGSALHVATDINTNSAIRISRPSSGYSTLQLYKGTSAMTGWSLLNDPNNDLRLNFDTAADSSGGSARMYFQSGGNKNVGIGTEEGQYFDSRSKLMVGGKILVDLRTPTYGSSDGDTRDGFEMIVGGTNTTGRMIVNKPSFEFWNNSVGSGVRANILAGGVELRGHGGSDVPAVNKFLGAVNTIGAAEWKNIGAVGTETLYMNSGARADCPPASGQVVTGIHFNGSGIPDGVYCKSLGAL